MPRAGTWSSAHWRAMSTASSTMPSSRRARDCSSASRTRSGSASAKLASASACGNRPPAGAPRGAGGRGLLRRRVLRPPHAERTRLEGPAGPLQALIETPATEVQGPQPVSAFAVVCHPHPLHGGTLDNKVVYTVARALEQLGAPAIRFNFRGVGTSAGSYDEGRGET